MRKTILDYQRSFYNEARSEGGSSAIVFGDEKDAGKTYELAQILKRHQIKFHNVKNDFTKNGKNYKKGFSYIIPKNQKQTRLIEAMFEKRTTFQDSLFYDVSAWALPLAFNLDYAEDVALSQAGDEVTDLTMKTPTAPNTSKYAYVLEWHEYYSPKALNLILQEGLRAKVGMQPFSLEGTEYDYGTIMIPVQNQKLKSTELHQFLTKISKETGVKITGVGTGLTKGIDLGSGQFRAIEEPKVAVIVGEGISPSDAGEIWHLFDTRYDMLITKLDTKNFGRMDLSRYTDIILPATWGSALDEGDTEKLKEWVRAGGTLIGFRNAGRYLENNELLKMKFKTKQDTAKAITFEQRGDYFGAQVIGGAIFEAKLDRSHPIAFGYKNNTLPLFRNTTLFVEADENSYNNPIQYMASPLLAGYISKPNLEELKNTVPFKTASFGRGQVIYFTDNTNFRAFWYGTNKLLMNAIFFGDEM
jgi:hypothetical protein